MAIQGITPRQLQERLSSGEPLLVLDVREHDEVALCAIDGSVHIPMGEIHARLRELDPSRTTVCVCHHGVRSAQVAAALERLGFQRLLNLSGGIDRWASDVEPGMPRY